MKDHFFYKKYLMILLSILISCSLFESNEDSKNLVGPTWELIEIRNGDDRLLFEAGFDWSYWIKFQNDGSVIGKNACNDCTGSFTKNGENINIMLSCTESACSEPSPYLGYGDDLSHSTTYEIKQDRLMIKVFYSDFGERILIHKEIN